MTDVSQQSFWKLAQAVTSNNLGCVLPSVAFSFPLSELNPCWFKIPCAHLASSKPPPPYFISVIFPCYCFFSLKKNTFTHLPLGDMYVYWWRKITLFVVTLELVEVSECIYLNADQGQFYLPLPFMVFGAVCWKTNSRALVQDTP